LQPPAGQMIEHADLLQHSPRLVERKHHAHGAEPYPLGAAGDGSNQQIGRWTVRETEMMLTEEDAFEAKVFDVPTGGDAGVEARFGYLWRHIFAEAARRIQELEDPRPDHALPPARLLVKATSPNLPATLGLCGRCSTHVARLASVFSGIDID